MRSTIDMSRCDAKDRSWLRDSFQKAVNKGCTKTEISLSLHDKIRQQWHTKAIIAGASSFGTNIWRSDSTGDRWRNMESEPPYMHQC